MLFAAFEGFLGNMLPRALDGTQFFVGFVAFVAVVVFLILKILGQFFRSKNTNTAIFGITLFLGLVGYLSFGLVYKTTFDRYAFQYPPADSDGTSGWHIAGDELTSEAVALADRATIDHKDHLALIDMFAVGPHDFSEIWTMQGMSRVKSRVITTYVSMVVSLMLCLASSIELIALIRKSHTIAAAQKRRRSAGLRMIQDEAERETALGALAEEIRVRIQTRRSKFVDRDQAFSASRATIEAVRKG